MVVTDNVPTQLAHEAYITYCSRLRLLTSIGWNVVWHTQRQAAAEWTVDAARARHRDQELSRKGPKLCRKHENTKMYVTVEGGMQHNKWLPLEVYHTACPNSYSGAREPATATWGGHQHHDESRDRSFPVGDALLPHGPLLPPPPRVTQLVQCPTQLPHRCLGRPLDIDGRPTSGHWNGRRVSRRCTNARLDSTCSKKLGAGEGWGPSAGRSGQVGEVFCKDDVCVFSANTKNVCLSTFYAWALHMFSRPRQRCTTAVGMV